MGKQECFICKEEMGRFSIKWKISDLNYKNIPIPLNMGEEDRVCEKCYDKGKKEAKETGKIEKQEKKEEFNAQIQDLMQRSPEYKKHWNKNGIIQFKNERIAILKRSVGAQVEFIVAYDDLTKDGYRLMAIDEGMQAQGTGLTGGVNAFFYFQKMEFVR